MANHFHTRLVSCLPKLFSTTALIECPSTPRQALLQLQHRLNQAQLSLSLSPSALFTAFWPMIPSRRDNALQIALNKRLIISAKCNCHAHSPTLTHTRGWLTVSSQFYFIFLAVHFVYLFFARFFTADMCPISGKRAANQNPAPPSPAAAPSPSPAAVAPPAAPVPFEFCKICNILFTLEGHKIHSQIHSWSGAVGYAI